MKINFSQLAVSAAALAQGFKSAYAVEGQQASLTLNTGAFAQPYKTTGDSWTSWVENPTLDGITSIPYNQLTTLKYEVKNVDYPSSITFYPEVSSPTANCNPVMLNNVDNHCGDAVSPGGTCNFAVQLDEACSAIVGESVVVQTRVNTNVLGESLEDTATLTVSGSNAPTSAPTAAPSAPSAAPTVQPTVAPTQDPSAAPSAIPSAVPSAIPSAVPSLSPSENPTSEPTSAPSMAASDAPSANPTVAPTLDYSANPTAEPTAAPTMGSSAEPSAQPTSRPTYLRTPQPTTEPTVAPTAVPTVANSAQPSSQPTYLRTAQPTAEPTAAPTAPTAAPTFAPTQATQPSSQPTSAPTGHSHILSDDANNDDFYKKRNEYVAICASVGFGLLALAGVGVYLSRSMHKQQVQSDIENDNDIGASLLGSGQHENDDSRNSVGSAGGMGDAYDTRASVSARYNPSLAAQALAATRGASNSVSSQGSGSF